ncbi:hypothetical protein CMEL01_16701 [Colletotrichum melonis]|uniref:Uncharacterized protein n=1 Tax=Colletotrichum melonis TaxID=1209925 RepID=A0AAI9UCL4_9PEZI|nr:hypothetical protein CMEL01_16701 [Colletotrichum melonis]
MPAAYRVYFVKRSWRHCSTGHDRQVPRSSRTAVGLGVSATVALRRPGGWLSIPDLQSSPRSNDPPPAPDTGSSNPRSRCGVERADPPIPHPQEHPPPPLGPAGRAEPADAQGTPRPHSRTVGPALKELGAALAAGIS